MATPSLLLIPDRYKAAKLYSQIPDSGAGDLDFARASVATRVNASGLIESVASGVPRLDYTGGGCPSLLLEPQRTNLLKRSEEINEAVWLKNDVTITTNGAVSPSGASSADIVVEGIGVSTQHRIQQSSLGASAGVYTLSTYIKNINGTRRAYIDAGPWGCFFNFSTLAIQTFGTGTATATAVGNGWYRLAMTGTASYTPIAVFLGLATTNETYTGDGTSSIAFWGTQFELGSYPTSYIPTLGSSVTRVADECSKTGISSLIGATEGTIFIDFIQKAVGASVVQIQLNDGSNSNRVQLEVNSSGLGIMYVFSGGGLTGQINLGTFNVGTRYKVAMAYKVNDFVTYINGVLAGTDTSGAVPVSMSRIDLGAEVGTPYTGYEFNQAALYTTRLSNSQLASLTSL